MLVPSQGSCSPPALSGSSNEYLGTESGSPSSKGMVSLWWSRGYSATSPEDSKMFIPWSPAGLWAQSSS